MPGEPQSAKIRLAIAILIVLAVTYVTPHAQVVDSSLSFFITGRSLETGGDFGGLAGADAHCQQLADSVGAGDRLWRAYLSTQSPIVNARDRIGAGPWFNANKVMIAANLTALHDTSNRNTINAANGLTHRGLTVARHDIVTGSKIDGMAPTAGADSTCGGWTSATSGSAIVGHHNRSGIQSNICQSCWNLSHVTNGCTQANLEAGGGEGYFYCFAADAGSTSLQLREASRRLASTRAYAPYQLGSWNRTLQVVYRFELEKKSRVDVSVHDLDGKARAVLLRGNLGAGTHAVYWDGTNSEGAALPSGMYFILLKKDGKTSP